MARLLDKEETKGKKGNMKFVTGGRSALLTRPFPDMRDEEGGKRKIGKRKRNPSASKEEKRCRKREGIRRFPFPRVKSSQNALCKRFSFVIGVLNSSSRRDGEVAR